MNHVLANKKGLSKQIQEEIQTAQDKRVIYALDCLSDNLSKEDYNKLYTANEYYLQSLWGFPLDARYHMFWDQPGCTCPKMDNRDAWGTGVYTIDSSCPLHGGTYEASEASVSTD